MFPPKKRKSYCHRVSNFGFSIWEHILPAELPSFHPFFKVCLIKSKHPNVLGPGDSRPGGLLFFVGHQKKNIDGSLGHFTCFIWGIQN